MEEKIAPKEFKATLRDHYQLSSGKWRLVLWGGKIQEVTSQNISQWYYDRKEVTDKFYFGQFKTYSW